MTSSEFNMLIGRNVRKYRLLYNAKNNTKLTQAKLAQLIGVTTPLIGALESNNNSNGIGMYNLYKISEILNVPVAKFFEEV